jgi:response regulator RpfG family c-di-GMP phosphodiesterase
MSKKSILLVDDDSKVLSALSRTLNEVEFNDIITAPNGLSALEIIKNTPDLGLIISDYRMPGLNGIKFLVQARKDAPDVTRILLTGAADLDMALDAINQGHIFRFLVKPCLPETLVAAVNDGLRQNELFTMERELLSKTLSGSIKVMVDILSLLSPSIFAQAGRLRDLAREMASALQLKDQAWEIELAAILSQIGAVTMPRNILERWHKGEPLEDYETNMIRSIPQIGKLLIHNIPRLENIAEAVGNQNCTFYRQANSDEPSADNIPLMARILKIIIDYERLIEKANTPSSAFKIMQTHESEYDPDILDTFRLDVLRLDRQPVYKLSGASTNEKEVHMDGIHLGMVLARDVVDKNGILIISSGTIITDVLMYKLKNYIHSQIISGPVYIENDY